MTAGMTEVDRMYSVRVAPWHLSQGTNVALLDAAPESREERLELSGQDWSVSEEPLFRRTIKVIGEEPVEGFEEVEGSKLLIRSDIDTILSVQRDSYGVVQNETGHELFEALSEGAKLDDGTGGTVKGGAMCYLSARLDEPYSVLGDPSPVYPYVVVTWTHDGSGAVHARRTTVRVVCWNTLSASEQEGERTGRSFTFRHTKSAMERIGEAKAILDGARGATKEFIALANELARTPVTEEVREAFIAEFIPAPATHLVVSDRVLDNINEARAKVRSIFSSPTIPENLSYTAYGLVQAGVEYLDHLRGYRNSDTYLGRTLLRDEPLKARLVPMVKELVSL